jgi:hypothetical protein
MWSAGDVLIGLISFLNFDGMMRSVLSRYEAWHVEYVMMSPR